MPTGKSIRLRHTLEDLDVQTSPSVTKYGGEWSFRYERKNYCLLLVYKRHTDSRTWAIHIESGSVKLLTKRPSIYNNTCGARLSNCVLHRNQAEVSFTLVDWPFYRHIKDVIVEMVIDIGEIYENTLECFTILLDGKDWKSLDKSCFKSESHGVKWELTAETYSHHVQVYLTCHREDQREWCFDVCTEFILNYDNPKTMQKDEMDLLYYKKNERVWIGELEGYAYADDEPVKLKVNMIVLKMSGIRKRKLEDFWRVKNVGEISNAYFTAEGKMFSANKRILAQHSPVFREMFSENLFEPSTKLIIIVEANQNDFQKFLSVINSEDCAISESEATGLLRLAERYDVEKVAEKAHDVLVYSSNKSVFEKLKLIEEYKLDSEKVIDSLDKKALKEVRKNIGELSVSTQMALFNRALDLLPGESTY